MKELEHGQQKFNFQLASKQCEAPNGTGGNRQIRGPPRREQKEATGSAHGNQTDTQRTGVDGQTAGERRVYAAAGKQYPLSTC